MILGFENMMLVWLWDRIKEEYVPEKKIDIEELEPEFRQDMRENRSSEYILRHDFC